MPRDVRMPRLTTEISEELKERIDKIPWGTRRAILQRLLEEVMDLYDKHGMIALAAIVSGELKVIEHMKEKEHGT